MRTSFILATFLIGCSGDGTTDAPECSENSDCDDGRICVDGGCQQLCNVSAD